MSVDVWFTQDISQIILAAVRANEQALAADLADRYPLHGLAYHQGFRAALSTVALALGLPIPSHDSDVERPTVAESPMAIHIGPCLFMEAENGVTHQSALPVVPVEESRGHGFAVV